MKPWKAIGVICMVVVGLAQTAPASLRSMYQDRSQLFLHEKVGQTENLLGNPARMNAVKTVLIENNADIQIQDSRPFDPVFDKKSTSEKIFNITQAIYPAGDWFTLNLGYAYTVENQGSESRSTLDSTIIQDMDTTSARKINAALSTAQIPGVEAGYALSWEEQGHYIDFYSDIAMDSSTVNEHRMIQHGLGIVYEGLELYGAYTQRDHLAYTNQIQEVDFSLNSLELNVRGLLGEVGQSNLLLQAGYTAYTLQQDQFVIGREDYDLDIPVSRVTLDGYFYYPWENQAAALGLEFTYDQSNLFDVSEYAWVNYQDIQVNVPAQIQAQILPWLRAWLEFSLRYENNSYLDLRTFSLNNAFGVRIHASILDIEIYTLPAATLTTSSKRDEVQQVETGLTITARF